MTARIVPPDEAAEVLGRGDRRESGLFRALIEGRMVHFDDDGTHFNSQHFRVKGYRLRSRRDGAGGRYWWADPL